MSRVGKLPVKIESGVTASIEGRKISVVGKLGNLEYEFSDLVVVSKNDNEQITVLPCNKDDKNSRAHWGLTRNLISNMIKGVSVGFVKELELKGVGFKAEIKGEFLSLSLGKSHDTKYLIPHDIKIECPKPTEIIIRGFDKQKVGQVAAILMKLRKVEPYKGKGVLLKGQRVLRKEGKKK
jgi:large subunit ribosomal protein L6